MSTDYLPSNDRIFLEWETNFLNYLMTSLTRFGFPQTEATKLSSLSESFRNKLNTAENPATRTKVAIEVKNKARKELESTLRVDVKGYLTYNPAVNDDDRTAMGLPIHKTTHTRSPVAKTYPDFDIDSSVIRWLKIHFFDQGKKKSKAKPAGQRGAVIRWVISATPIVDIADLTNYAFDSRTPFTLEFQGHERGLTVYFCLCWENTRGERGPWSEIQSAIIP
ncbi:MAG: hypothetical protein LBL07_01120 [Tannerella sp.]|jgi:hypothetical protein|nr:hypothetical protein [Tannerella sp.]